MSDAFDFEEAPDGALLSGAGAPAATLGRNDDRYVDLGTGILWQKIGDTWTAQNPIDGFQRETLATTFVTGSATEVDITGIAGFAPTANGVYEIEAKLIVASTAAATGCRPSIFVPTGIADLAYELRSSTGSLNSDTILWGGPANFLNQLSHPAANVGYLARLTGIVSVGGAPGAGNIRPRVRSESAGTNVEIRRGSSFKWRRLL